MASVNIKDLNARWHPDHYEGSYLDIFTHVNFNFLAPFFPTLKKCRGRPPYQRTALFGSLLWQPLMPAGEYRSTEAKLQKHPDMKLQLGFDIEDAPSDSVLRQFFDSLETPLLYEILGVLVQELRAYGLINGRITSLDSTPLEAHAQPPTKTHPVPSDPDAAWGFAKCKKGWYYGYKAQILIDAEGNLPLYPIITPANVSDQVMLEPFLDPLKKWGIIPEFFVADKGYDSGKNHRLLREGLGSIGLIAVNKRRGKFTYTRKTILKAKKLMMQTVLEDFIPVKKRERAYRQCSRVLQHRRPWKKIRNRRALSEQTNSRLKEVLEIERLKVRGLQNVAKYILLKCIGILTVALTAARMGTPELARCIRYFQN